MPYRIDLHIHTISSRLDTDFEFSMDALARHVESNGLSAIAITNHNLFDRENYDLVRDALRDVLVLPGVEVSVESCHVLYVTSQRNVNGLQRMCEGLDGIKRGERGMDLGEFMGRFCDGSGLVIPHYGKSPSIREEDLDAMLPHVSAFEVGSEKKWARTYEDDGVRVPVVMFSDFHACDEVDRRSLGRYTYADFDGRTYGSLCLALKDKARFSVTERGVGVELEPGLLASDKLNVVFGSRSSGKTHLLDRIRATYDPDEVMYIRQFEIVRDADEARFKAPLRGDREGAV